MSDVKVAIRALRERSPIAFVSPVDGEGYPRSRACWCSSARACRCTTTVNDYHGLENVTMPAGEV